MPSFDVHCHVIDTPDTLPSIIGLRTTRLALMATRLDNLASVASAHSVYAQKILPGFGIHPWFAHETLQAPDWLSSLQRFVDAHPQAFVALTSRQIATHPLTGIKYDFGVQMDVFCKQWALAAKANVAVSVHCVHAHGDLLLFLRSCSLDKTAANLPKRIMLHSYTGSVDIMNQLLKLPRVGSRIYFSFSTVVNARSFRLAERIRETPDDRLLLESDIHNALQVDECMQDIAKLVSDIKGWTIEETFSICWGNSQTFFS